MDQSTSSKSRRLTILSNVVLTPQKIASQNVSSIEPEIIDITFDDVDEESSQTPGKHQPFTNLYFQLPSKNDFSEKRKLDCSFIEQSGEKRMKIEKVEDDEEEKVFNYMTGTYESVVKTELSPNEHEPEDLIVEEKHIVSSEDEPHLFGRKQSDTVLSNVHVGDKVVGRSSSKNITLHIPSNSMSPNTSFLSQNNSLNFLFQTPILNLPNCTDVCQNPPKVASTISQKISLTIPHETSPLGHPNSKITPLNLPTVTSSSESYTICDNNSNNSTLLMHSPTPQVDDSSDDLIAIETPKNNSSLINKISAADAESSGGIFKNLLLHVNTSSNSNKLLSESNTSCEETHLDKQNINADQTSVNLNVGNDVNESDMNKAKKYFVNKLRGKLSLLNWNCKTCGFTAKTKSNLILHIYNEHLKDDFEMKIKCKNCHFECDTQSDMKEHELTHRVSVSDEDNALSTVPSFKTFDLTVGVSSNNQNSRIENIQVPNNRKTQNKRNDTDILEIIDVDDDLPSATNTKHFLCFFCNFKASKLSNLRYHAGTHHGNKYYCNDHFWTNASLACTKCIFENVMINIKDYFLTCKICGYSTTRRYRFKEHSSRPFGCQTYMIRKSKKRVENTTQSSTQLIANSTHEYSQNAGNHKNFVSADNSNSKERQNLSNSEVAGLNSDDESVLGEEDLAISWRCLDCGANFSKKMELKRHALQCHPNSAFRCDVHESKIDFHQCEKCVYELIFRNFTQKLVVEDCFGMDSSDISKFNNSRTSKNGSARQEPKYKKPRFNKETDSDDDDDHSFLSIELSDSDASLHNESTEIRYIKTRAAKTKGLFAQKNQLQSIESKESSSDGSSIPSNSAGSAIKIKVLDRTERKVTCFDCKLFTEKSLYKLRRHAYRHVGSKYQCIEHYKNCQENCLKCRYQLVLQQLRKTVKVCKSCGLTTYDKYNYLRHVKSKQPCRMGTMQRKLFQGEVLCFGCQYATMHKNLLKYHMVDHLDQEFSCESHPEKKDMMCLECIHEECLKNAKREVLICQTCQYKTVDKEIFAVHGCKETSIGGSTDDLCEERQQVCNSTPAAASGVAGINATATKSVCFDHTYNKVGDELSNPQNNAKSEIKVRNIETPEQVGNDIIVAEKCIIETNPGDTCNGHNENVSESDAEESLGNDEAAPEPNIEESLDNSCSTNGKNETDIPNIKNVIQASIRMDKSSKDLNVTEKSSENNAENQMEVPNSENIEHALETGSEKHSVTTINPEKDAQKETNIDIPESVLDCADSIETHNTVKYVDTSKTKKISNDSKSFQSLMNNNSDAGKQIKLRCFDCKFVTENSAAFQEHVCRHIGSKFDCMEHNNNKFEECSKCYYKVTLQNLNKEIKSCEICGYKTLKGTEISQHITRDGSCEKWYDRKLLPQEIICFKCQYITKYKKFLMYHMVDHSDENLICKKHGENKDEKCLHCINEECLQNAKKKTLKCNKCNFKTTIKQIFDRHHCEESLVVNSEEIAKQGVSKDLSNTVNVVVGTDNTQSGKVEAVLLDCNDGKTDRISGTGIQDISENDNIGLSTTSLQEQKAQNNIQSESLGKTLAENALGGSKATLNLTSIGDKQSNAVLHGLRCFDCSFTCSDGNYNFRRHLVLHIGSKFQCVQHPKIKINDCQKCHYEITLQLASQTAKFCEHCNYKTIRATDFQRHLEVKDACSNWINRKHKTGEFWCSKCFYVTTHKSFLKYHMVDHLDATLSCNNHAGKHKEACNACLNVKCLETAKREVKTCKKCNYKTLIQQVLNLHECNVEKRMQVKCFDCKYYSLDCSDIVFKEHVYRHIGSKYKCMEHWGSKAIDCLKCQYEEVLNIVHKSAKICKICGYKAFDKMSLTNHLTEFGSCSNWVNRSLLPDEIRCIECQYVTIHKKFLKYHMVDHLDVTLSCEEHQEMRNERCEKCINKECLEDAKNEINLCQKCSFKTVIKQFFDMHECESAEVADIDVSSLKGIRCFDCRYWCKDKNLHHFRKHVSRHFGSKYRCMEHLKFKVTDCPKCLYERTLQEIPSRLKICAKCGYKTIDKNTMTRHEEGAEACKKWLERKLKPGQVKCFDCQYMTTHKKFLKYHMVDHLNVEFVCGDHPQDKNEDCLKCIYENCLKSAKKEVIVCEECNFKSVIRQIFKVHECRQQNEELDGATAKEYQCFNCDKFTTRSAHELEEHTVLLHDDSSFRCDEHDNMLDNCPKCFYQNVVEGVQKSLIVCEICMFKTCSEDAYNSHKCDVRCEFEDDLNESEDKKQPQMFVCYHCEYQSNFRSNLRNHAIRHHGDKFKCDIHKGLEKPDCKKCIYEYILKSFETLVKICKRCEYKTLHQYDFDQHIKNNACSLVQRRMEMAKGAPYFFKCFDCGEAYHKEYPLKAHAVNHLGSTFKCDNHDSLDRNCQKCVYEDIIKNTDTSTFTCFNCGFKAYNWLHLKCHEKSRVNCQLHRAKLLAEGKKLDISQKRIFQCFDCSFFHQRKDFLMRHVVVHEHSTFQCKEHKELSEDCPKCEYRQMLNQIPKRFRCFDCTPSVSMTRNEALKRHISRKHKNSFYVCVRHSVKSRQCPECFYEYMVKQTNQRWYDLICGDCNVYFRDKETLKSHIKKCHSESSFACNDHTQCREVLGDCNSCVYEELVQNCREEESAASTSKAALQCYRCFDCDYETFSRTSLTTHTRKNHLESSFTCKEHILGDINETSCDMCIYESVLLSCKQDVTVKCSKCNFEALGKDSLDRHYKENHSKEIFTSAAIVSKDFLRKRPDKYQCFECSYTTNTQDNLFQHLSEPSHGDSSTKFKCNKHKLFESICPKCVFAKLKNKVREK